MIFMMKMVSLAENSGIRGEKKQRVQRQEVLRENDDSLAFFFTFGGPAKKSP
jgi:hypothetical protein